MTAALPPKTWESSPIGDAVTLVVWSLLAAFAVCVLLRLPRERRHAWMLVSGYCVIIAVDKAVDLLTLGYLVLRRCRYQLDAVLGYRVSPSMIRIGVLVPLTLAALFVTIWFIRRDRALDRGKLSAIAGLVLVILLVGLRSVPGFAGVVTEYVGWVIEGVACLLITLGLWHGWRQGGSI